MSPFELSLASAGCVPLSGIALGATYAVYNRTPPPSWTENAIISTIVSLTLTAALAVAAAIFAMVFSEHYGLGIQAFVGAIAIQALSTITAARVLRKPAINALPPSAPAV